MHIPLNRSFYFFLVAAISASVGFLVWRFQGFYFSAQDLAGLSLLRNLPLAGIFAAPSALDPAGHLYQPLADLLIRVQVQLFGGHPAPYVLVILALHLICALLLYCIAQPVIHNPAAGLAALFFAWHPMVSGLFSSLVEATRWGFLLLFLLLCLWGLSFFRRRKRRLGLGLSTIAMVCASAMGPWYSLPLVLFLYDLALPREEDEPRRIKRLFHQLPIWIAFAIPFVAGFYITHDPHGSGSGAAVPDSGALFNAQSFRMLPGFFLPDRFDGLSGLRGESGFHNTGLGIMALTGLGLLLSAFRFRLRFAGSLLLCLLIFLAVFLPMSGAENTASRCSLYALNAFACLCLGLMACGFMAGHAAPLRTRAASLLPIIALACGYGFMIHTVSPLILEPGAWIRESREQVLNLIGPDYPEKKPVFLLNTPDSVLPLAQNNPSRTEPLPLQSLGLAFAPPFLEKAVKLYPLHSAPWLSGELHVPFLLHMWGDGELMKFDEESGLIRWLHTEEINRAFLGQYWTHYCQGDRPSLLKVQMPVPKMSMPFDSEKGFPVVFPFRKAKAERVVLLTRYGAAAIRFDEIRIDMITRQGKKPYINLEVFDRLIRQALVFFPGESVYMWVESIDDNDAVFHRSELIRFYLI